MTDLLLRATIEQISAIPTLPVVALRIMRIVDDPLATEEMLYDAMIGDPALAARVLKVVNSAFYRRQREVSELHAAIRMLGNSAIRNIALASSLHRLFSGRRAISGFDPADVWVHSVAVSVAARTLAARTGKAQPEEAMLAGLLHDLGVIVALHVWPVEFAGIVEEAETDTRTDFLEIERRVMGVTHADLGATLCDHWQFPRPLVAVCRYHHDVGALMAALPGTEQALPAVVHVADAVAARVGSGYVRTVLAPDPDHRALAFLGVDAQTLDAVVDEVREALPMATGLLSG
jgi:HD-like signal output (HDOD) protein